MMCPFAKDGCVEDDCALYDDEKESCAFLVLARMRNRKKETGEETDHDG